MRFFTSSHKSHKAISNCKAAKDSAEYDVRVSVSVSVIVCVGVCVCASTYYMTVGAVNLVFRLELIVTQKFDKHIHTIL